MGRPRVLSDEAVATAVSMRDMRASCEAIGQVLRVNAETVSRALRRVGKWTDLRRALDEAGVVRARELRARGLSCDAIGLELKVHGETVRRAIARAEAGGAAR